MSLKITFVRWHNSVASESIVQGYRVKNKLSLSANPQSTTAGELNSKGVYGVFDGIFFGIYSLSAAKDLKLSICIRDDVFDIAPASVIKHEVSLRKNTFSIGCGRNPSVVFFYHKLLWTLLHGSMTEKADYFFDDWWSLECDLPSWIASSFNNHGVGVLATGIDARCELILPRSSVI